MIGVWIDRTLHGAPDEAMTVGLVVIAALLIVVAFRAPSWLKLAAIVWVVAP